MMTNTSPVIAMVMSKVWSIWPQFEATGVNHQGLNRLKATEATTIISRTIAIAIGPCLWRPPGGDTSRV